MKRLAALPFLVLSLSLAGENLLQNPYLNGIRVRPYFGSPMTD